MSFFDLSKTIFCRAAERYEYPWQVLPEISDFIKRFLYPPSRTIYTKKREGNIGYCPFEKDSLPTAFIGENVIICEDAEVRHCLLSARTQ